MYDGLILVLSHSWVFFFFDDNNNNDYTRLLMVSGERIRFHTYDYGRVVSLDDSEWMKKKIEELSASNTFFPYIRVGAKIVYKFVDP